MTRRTRHPAGDRRKRWWARAFLGLLGGALPAGAPALAAPQLLALVNDPRPVAVQCLHGDCFAEFTAFCLQPERRSPATGTRYHITRPGDIEIAAVDRHGRPVAVDAARDLTITAQRTHVAVRIGMPAQRMRELGIRDLTIRIAANVTLRPQPWTDDPNPLNDGEIEMVSTWLRQLGSRIVDTNRKEMGVARIASRMINHLAPGGRVSADQRDGVWQRAVEPADLDGLPADTVQKARDMFTYCRDETAIGNKASMRGCLESQHDHNVGRLNNRYWQAVRTGS
jgi:hypothetical protein